MATPTHPNRFAVGQRVLFQHPANSIRKWTEGVIGAVYQRNSIGDGCAEDCELVTYTVFDTHQGRVVATHGTFTGKCACEGHIADLDPTGRWYGQQITSSSMLELLLVDAERRGERLHRAFAPADDQRPDRFVFYRRPDAPEHDALAWVAVYTLLEGTTGIAASRWLAPEGAE